MYIYTLTNLIKLLISSMIRKFDPFLNEEYFVKILHAYHRFIFISIHVYYN